MWLRRTTPVALLFVLACVAGVVSLAQRDAFLTPLDGGRVTYYIASDTSGPGYRQADADLAAWAFKAWEAAARGALRFEPSPEDEALIRLYWISPSAHHYGSTRALTVNGRRAAAVYVQTDTEALGDIGRAARSDELLRDTIVYLTCVHEIGHALGLEHTDEFADIMYSFQYGGDIPGYFRRYRAQLKTRSDIARAAVLSPGDTARLRVLYPRK